MLRDLIFDGRFEQDHKDIRQLVRHEVFHSDDTYAKARFVNSQLEPATELVANPYRLFALTDWLAVVCPATMGAVSIHYNLALGTLVEFGRGRDDLDAYIDELRTMSSFGVYLATELEYGNNVVSLRTEAAFDRATNEFVLNTPTAGAQKFPQNTGKPGVPKLAIVFARLKVDDVDHGVFPFVVPLSDALGPLPGVRISPLPDKALSGVDSAITSFHNVRLPRRALLSGDFGSLAADGTFTSRFTSRRQRFLASLDRIQSGKLSLAGASAASARAALYIAIRYAQHRMTFAAGRPDVPIIAYRSHQKALFGALATTYAMTLLLNRTRAVHVERKGDDVNRLVAVTKAMVTDAATGVFDTCRERCGAQGIFRENRIIDYLIANHAWVTAEGDNMVTMIKAARELLELEPPSHIATDDLSSPANWISIFGAHERELHHEVTAAMTTRLSAGESLFDAWNGSINAALDLAAAHGTRLALEQFVAAIERVDDPALRDLAELYALGEIAKIRHVPRLRTRVDELCAALEPHASRLVEAFEITDDLLGASITRSDYLDRFDFRSSSV